MMSTATGQPKTPIRLRYRGERSYVQGSDLYDAVVGAMVAKRPGEPITDLRMTMHGFVRRQCQLQWMDGARSCGGPPETKLGFRCRIGETEIAGWLSETDEAITERVPYAEDEIVRQCVVDSGCATCERPSGFSPIEVVIAITKELHQRRYPDRAGKWIIVRLDLERVFEDRDRRLDVELERRLTDRLTKCRIAADGKRVGAIYFSLLRP